MPVALTAILPKDEENNGLPDMIGDLVGRPGEPVVAVVVLDVARVTHKVDTNEVTPTLKIRTIEPVRDTDDRHKVVDIAMRATETRTGNVTLPLDHEADEGNWFGGDAA
jgi:hypothetical protein